MALRLFCVSRSHVTNLVQANKFTSLTIRHINNKNGRSIYRKEETKKIGLFVVSRYFDYIRNYDQVLEKRFPKAMSVYNSFKFGVADFLKDVKEFMKIVKIVNSSENGLKALTRKEMELYDKLPKDMIKIAPTLFVSMLPFAFYVVLPLIFMYPKYLLTSQFWNEKQKIDFGKEILRSRLSHNTHIFRYLQASSIRLEQHELFQRWSLLLSEIRSGATPRPQEVIACKALFMEKPFHIHYLSWRHTRHLLQLHDLRTRWFRRDRLTDHAVLLKAMDYAISMEGGIHNMPIDALRRACEIRGLNTTDMSEENMVKWMQSWMIISSAIDKNSLSLLLHVPLFLGYNQPSNHLLLETITK